MEPFTSPIWNPEWIWGIGIIALGLTLACVMLFNRRRSAPEEALRDNITRKRYDEQDRADRADEEDQSGVRH
jgi:hypothetical protein